MEVVEDITHSEFAAAKVNLWLHILGKRADGYHELDSLVMFADIGDRLEFSAAKELSFSIGGEFGDGLRMDEGNLVCRAAVALSEAVGVDFPVHIKLVKDLPIAAGVGGGSADAAACLRGLIEYFGLEIEDGRLEEIALSLGADVPVCLKGYSVIMRGFGDVLLPLEDMPKFFGLMVNSGVEVSTAEVFGALEGRFSDAVNISENGGDWLNIIKGAGNDLMGVAVDICPEISDVLGVLGDSDGCLLARMSGSGGACFGIFESEEKAKSAARKILDNYGDWWVKFCRFGKN